MNILFSLLLLKFKLRPTKGLRLTRGRTSLPLSRGYFRTLRHKAESVWRLCTCVCVCVVRSLLQGQRKTKRERLTFFPGGTRFWLVLRMCVRAFLMFFSFMLDSTAGGRNRERPHSFLWRADHCKSVDSVQPQCETWSSSNRANHNAN